MKTQLQHRLQELRHEYTSGQKVLADLENQQKTLQHTLLRIQGAIQVLEEELAKAQPDAFVPLADEFDATTFDNTTFDSAAIEVLMNRHG